MLDNGLICDDKKLEGGLLWWVVKLILFLSWFDSQIFNFLRSRGG